MMSGDDAFTALPDLPGEVWRDVVGLGGHYSVSNIGRVRSNARTKIRSNGSPIPTPTRIIKARDHNGYSMVSMTRADGVCLHKFVHRLVMAAFVGPIPDGMEVCHGDGTRSNNRLHNLRYGTRSDNVQDALKHGTHRSHGLKGEQAHGAILVEADVLVIRSSKEAAPALAARFKVSDSAIKAVRSRKTWKHVA